MSVSTLTQPSATVGPLSPGPLRRLAGDTGTMIARSLRLVSRDPDSIIMGIVLPVMLMVLFVHVFGGAMNVGGDYLSYVTPGIILLCAGFGAANTAIAVEHDMSSGIMDRFRSMPVASATVLTGHVIASVAKNLVTTAVVFGVAFLMGFRADAGLLEWLGAIAVIVLYVLAITWVATLVGVLVRSPDAASGFTFFMLFLPYVSSAFVPVDTMPGWLQGFADNQPVTPVIETIRGLLVGTELGNAPALAVAWCVGISAVFLSLAAAAFARRRQQ